jgi:thioesterase domain-containing protein
VHAGTIVAFVATEETAFGITRLAEAVAAQLPSHMRPTSYVRIDTFPLTHAGKIDRRALLAYAEDRGGKHIALGDAVHFTALEEQVAQLWRDAFGTALDGVTLRRDSDFFTCGGHSLLAVRLLSSIERAFGRKLSVANLIGAPTLAEQARLIGGRDADAPQSAGTPTLVPLRKCTVRDGNTPLFLIHPVGGDVSCYLSLVRSLAVDTEVYGVQAPEAHPHPSFDPKADLAARAAAYLSAIQSVQSHGPYRLGGWSLGGILAFEMARQLIAAGEDVDPVLLIDCYAPRLLAEIEIDQANSNLLAIFSRDLIGDAGAGALVRADGRDILAVEDLYGIPELSVALAGVDEASLASRFAAFRSNVHMARTYEPPPCAVAACLFTASGGHPDLSRGWSNLVSGGLTIHELPGDHYSLLTEPAVSRLATLIDEVL